MNKIIPSLVAITLVLTVFAPVAHSQEEATAGGAIDTDTIKQNVKKRIEEVFQNDNAKSAAETPLAYMGILEDRANNTLSIQTSDGIKLASASAEVATVRLPDNEDIGLADVGLGEYVMALGFLNGDEVLTTHRLLVNEDSPETPTNQVFFGSITSVEDDVITLRNATSNQEQELFISRNSDISLWANGSKEELDADEIPLEFNALVIFVPEDESVNDTDTVLEMLIRSGNPEDAPVATKSGTTR